MPFKEKYPDSIYKFFFDNSIELLCVATVEGNFVKLNAKWEKTLGYSLDELEKKPYLEFVHPDDVQVTIQAVQQLSENKQVYNFKNRYKHKNGSYLWLEWRSYPMDNLIFASARHITPSKEIEETLQKSGEQNRLEDLDKISMAMQSTDDLNDMIKKVVEVTRSIFKCDRALLIFPNDPETTTWEIATECSSPEYPCTFKIGVPIPMTPGIKKLFTQLNSMQEQPLELSTDKEINSEENPWEQFQAESALVTTLHPTQGKSWLFGIQQCSEHREWASHEKKLFQEISRRLNDRLSSLLIYKNLQENEDFYNKIFENIPNMIFIKDAKTLDFIKINHAGEKLLGLTRKEVLNKNVYDLFPKEDAEYYALKDHEAIKNKGLVEIEEETVRNQKNEIIYLQTKKIPILDENGIPKYLIGISEDISNRKQIESERLVHLSFLENLDKINRAIQGTNDIEQMMKDVLDETLSILKCDRAFLVYPCDPDTLTFEIPMERTTPEYPGGSEMGVPFPATPTIRKYYKTLLDSDVPLELVGKENFNSEADNLEEFEIKSMLSIAIHPKTGKPWQFGLHQCSYTREWTSEENKLFLEISRRLADGLSTFLIYKNQRNNEAFLNKIFENIPNMLFVKDAETLNFVKINRAGEKLLGYSQQKLYGKNNYDIFSKKDADNFTFSDKQALQTKKLVNIPEEKIKNKYNEVRYLHTRKLPILNELGKPKYILGISEDITEQKQTEMALEQTRMLTDTLLESIPGLVYIYNEDNRLELWNKRLETETGYSGKELFLKPLMDWFQGSKKDIDAIQAGLAQMYNGEFGHAEAYLQKKNGEKTPYYFTAVRTVINGKKYFVGIGIDITTQIKAESALRETKERLEAFLNSATDSISIYDSKMRLAEINRFSFKYLPANLKKEDVIGTNITDFLTRFKVNSVLQNYQKVLTTGIPYYSEDKIVLEGNAKVWFNTKVFKVGNGIGIIFDDISALKKAEEEVRSLNAELEHRVAERTAQLEQANQDLESFAYSVSHDLRAPIRHIDGFVRLIQANIAQPDAKIVPYFDKIFSASKRMSEMIDELLNFSRLGRKTLNFKPVKLYELVCEILDQLKPDFANRKITWKIKDMPTVDCDRSLMKIAFENIISNAIKYTSKVPEAYIEIGTKSVTKDMTVVYFKDNGAGFDMVFADKLFGVFQRLHSNDDFEGVGIGLANVKQIILKHNGQITVDSKINEGTTFYLYLPKNLKNE